VFASFFDCVALLQLCAAQAVLDPGDVMLVLSPHWPLINSMVHTASAVPIEVCAL
jgi:aspartate/methionine/tyrosine aminotransferase